MNKSASSATGSGAAPIGTALVFADDYYPNAALRITARLPESITVDMLNGFDDEGIRVISQPDDYDGYVITYGFMAGANYAFLFTKQYLQPKRWFRIGGDASYFSSRLNLIEAPLTPLVVTGN